MIDIKTIIVGQLKCNCYIISNKDNDEAIVIDPGDDADYIVNNLVSLGKNPVKIIATHGHFDHNMAAFEIQKAYNIPYFISENDYFLLKNIHKSAKYFSNIEVVKIPEPNGYLKENKKILFDNSFFKIIDVPGHTPGSVAIYNPQEKIVFVGDLIFKGGAIGRYDFSYSNKNDLFESIIKILSLPEKTLIYPGHGNSTTVESERLFH